MDPYQLTNPQLFQTYRNVKQGVVNDEHTLQAINDAEIIASLPKAELVDKVEQEKVLLGSLLLIISKRREEGSLIMVNGQLSQDPPTQYLHDGHINPEYLRWKRNPGDYFTNLDVNPNLIPSEVQSQGSPLKLPHDAMQQQPPNFMQNSINALNMARNGNPAQPNAIMQALERNQPDLARQIGLVTRAGQQLHQPSQLNARLPMQHLPQQGGMVPQVGGMIQQQPPSGMFQPATMTGGGQPGQHTLLPPGHGLGPDGCDANVLIMQMHKVTNQQLLQTCQNVKQSIANDERKMQAFQAAVQNGNTAIAASFPKERLAAKIEQERNILASLLVTLQKRREEGSLTMVNGQLSQGPPPQHLRDGRTNPEFPGAEQRAVGLTPEQCAMRLQPENLERMAFMIDKIKKQWLAAHDFKQHPQVNIPEHERQEYAETFNRLLGLVEQMDSGLATFMCVLNGEQVLSKIIAVIGLTLYQRQQSTQGRYIINLRAMRLFIQHFTLIIACAGVALNAQLPNLSSMPPDLIKVLVNNASVAEADMRSRRLPEKTIALVNANRQQLLSFAQKQGEEHQNEHNLNAGNASQTASSLSPSSGVAGVPDVPLSAMSELDDKYLSTLMAGLMVNTDVNEGASHTGSLIQPDETIGHT